MHLEKIWFDLISEGIKTIEVRLNDEKRKNIKIGDLITFNNDNDIINTKVINLYYYDNFEQMLNNVDITRVAGYNMNKDAYLKELSKYYSKELMLQYGVVAIEIERINV